MIWSILRWFDIAVEDFLRMDVVAGAENLRYPMNYAILGQLLIVLLVHLYQLGQVTALNAKIPLFKPNRLRLDHQNSTHITILGDDANPFTIEETLVILEDVRAIERGQDALFPDDLL